MNEKRRISIFVDAHVFDGEYQGTRTFIEGLYKAMLNRPNVHVFLAANDLENLKKQFPESKNITYLKLKSKSSFKRLAIEIPILLKKYKVDYAHFQYVTPPIKSCKYIVTTHDVLFTEYPEEFSWYYRLSKKILFKNSAFKADILTTVSDFSKKSIRKFLGINKKEIIITPNAVADKFFVPYNKGASRAYILSKYKIEKFILYVSRIEPRKNHLLLLKAYLSLKLYEKGYFLILLGKVSIPVPELDNLLSGLPENHKKYIFMSSLVDDNDLIEFYRAADVFVYPSKAEGFGIPPLEAAACRTPVLCSNASAMSDFDFFGEYHIDPTDLDLFEKKLEKILKSPPSESYLNQISEIIQNKYCWEVSALTLYQQLMFPTNRRV